MQIMFVKTLINGQTWPTNDFPYQCYWTCFMHHHSYKKNLFYLIVRVSTSTLLLAKNIIMFHIAFF